MTELPLYLRGDLDVVVWAGNFAVVVLIEAYTIAVALSAIAFF